jgi:hypothetical protein
MKFGGRSEAKEGKEVKEKKEEGIRITQRRRVRRGRGKRKRLTTEGAEGPQRERRIGWKRVRVLG